MTTRKFKKSEQAILIVLIGLQIFSVPFGQLGAQSTSSQSISNLANQQKETNKKIEQLEAKAEMYRKVIEIKQQQQGTLIAQIELMEAEIAKLESEIEIKKSEIEDLNEQISRIENQIKEQEASISSQKTVLGNLLQVYYENKRQDMLNNFLKNDDYSFMAEDDRLLQTEDKLKEIISNINALKRKLVEEKTTIETNRNKVADILIDLGDKSSDLASKKEQKELLIEETNQEQEKYEKLLAKVEEQKMDLLNIDELASSSGLSADKYPKPTVGLASTDWYYSQKDSRWGNDQIGRSNSKMKDWGCAITAVAMTINYFKGTTTPKELASKSKYFYWDLIVWPEEWTNPNLKLTSYGHSHGNIDWTVVDQQLKKGNPVIVYIKKKKVGGGHYVVIHHKLSNGKYVVHDPYFGPNLYLDTSMKLVGLMGQDSESLIDQMIIYNKK